MDIKIVRPKSKRYGWLRLYNDFPGHPKWRLISKKTGCTLSEVESVAARILVRANRGRPRGSIADFSCEEVAADIDIHPTQVVAIYQELEHNGWIDQEYLSSWDERQPDKEDTTAAERQARRRAKLRQQRGEHKESRRDSVTITPKTQTQTKKKKDGNVTAITGQTLTWKEAEELRRITPVPRQIPLALPPVAMNRKKEVGR